jgi:hypothetical protein
MTDELRFTLLRTPRAPAGIFILVLAALALTRMTAMSETVSEFDKVLPETIDVWKKAGPPGVYTPETLSTYIDGGAELYISYNFRSALSVKYTDASQREITVDIFDMGSSLDAFGVFAHSRESVETDLGQGSEYASGLLNFWKDRYYVSILAYPEAPTTRDVVFRLGRAIADAIPNEGPLPPILDRLPTEGLIPETVRYFHHYIWINSFYFVSNDNVLNIEKDTPVTLAKYRREGTTSFLLLVQYPDADRAKTAADRFRRDVLGGAADGIRALGDGRWAGLSVHGALVSVVLGAPDASTVRDALARVKP